MGEKGIDGYGQKGSILEPNTTGWGGRQHECGQKLQCPIFYKLGN